jgi:acyl dehydratase
VAVTDFSIMSERNSTLDGGAVRDMTRAWLRASGHLANSVLEANRATLAAFGLTDDDERDTADTFGDPEWAVERTVEDVAALEVGDEVRFSKHVSDQDILAYARASGDTNRLHLDEDYAAETRFRGRIAHGGLVSGLISAALARLPGVTIYLSQDLKFVKPVRADERLEAVVEVVEALGDGRFRLSTTVYDEDEEAVVEGEAVVLVEEAPEGEDRGVVEGT